MMRFKQGVNRTWMNSLLVMLILELSSFCIMIAQHIFSSALAILHWSKRKLKEVIIIVSTLHNHMLKSLEENHLFLSQNIVIQAVVLICRHFTVIWEMVGSSEWMYATYTMSSIILQQSSTKTYISPPRYTNYNSINSYTAATGHTCFLSL